MVNSQRIHELQDVAAFYWCSLAVEYAAADEEYSELDITLQITTLEKFWTLVNKYNTILRNKTDLHHRDSG